MPAKPPVQGVDFIKMLHDLGLVGDYCQSVTITADCDGPLLIDETRTANSDWIIRLSDREFWEQLGIDTDG